MKSDVEQFRNLVTGMRKEFSNGGNAMEFARNSMENAPSKGNMLAATLIAYDLQAGCYSDLARTDPEANYRWCSQLSERIDQILPKNGTLLEVGVGEATTLAGVSKQLEINDANALGFDLSWSRINAGRNWLAESSQGASLFVGDLFSIPLEDNSVDVVYSSHSLEPNGGRELEAISECLRVARQGVILVEPAYELADSSSQSRMKSHGYVRNLQFSAEQAGARVLDYRLLDYSPNPMNPSGILVLSKESVLENCLDGTIKWQCPLTGTALIEHDEMFYAPEVGIAYPLLRGIPLLRSEHAIVASGCKP